MANEIIKNNQGRKAKTLWTDHAEGEQVDFRQFESAYDEAEAIVRDIRENRSRYDYGKCAVLYRTNAQSRLLEEFCVRDNVPYRLVGGVNFYQRKEIKDILAYVKTVAGGRDDLAVRRIINEPKRGIGQTTITRLSDYAAEHGLSFLEAVEVCQLVSSLSGGTVNKLKEFMALIDGIRGQLAGFSVKGLIETIAGRSGYLAALQAEKTVEAESRIENIEELMNKAEEYSGIEDTTMALDAFLADVSLIADVDSLEEDENRVVLMTLHGAKGLEFPRVYMAGMEDGLFPGNTAIFSEDDTDLEEERRLCYVGVTRAMEKLTLTAAKRRMVNGETHYSPVSRFVEEIPKSLLAEETGKAAGFGHTAGFGQSGSFGQKNAAGSYGAGSSYRNFDRPEPVRAQKGSTPPQKVTAYLGRELLAGKKDTVDYGVGDRVRHVKFGDGTVKDMVQGKRDYEVTVEFDTVGVKKLFAAFAGLKKI